MTVRSLAAAAVLLTALTACASPAGSGDLTMTDPWAKAADSGMTAAFGTLVNDTDQDITIVAASSDVARMELHEMAMSDGEMVMRPKEGGIVVPAGEEHELAPGGDHIMFMDLTEPLEPGDEVAVTLEADDGTQWTITVPVRTFTGAEEDYEPGAHDMSGDS